MRGSRDSPKPSSLDDWMGVYNLAAMWAFESVSTRSFTDLLAFFLTIDSKVQKTASEALKSQIAAKSGMECIQIGQEYDVGPWIKRGIYLLIKQNTSLDFWVMSEEWGLSLKTIGLIYHYRDQALFETVHVSRGSTHGYGGGVYFESATYFDRKVEGMKEGAEKIFALKYSAYGGLGKDDLDVDNFFSTSGV